MPDRQSWNCAGAGVGAGGRDVTDGRGALLGGSARTRRAPVLTGRLRSGGTVLAHAVRASVRRAARAIDHRTAGRRALREDPAGEVGAAVLARLTRRIAELLLAAIESRLAHRRARGRIVPFLEAPLLHAVGDGRAAGVAGGGLLVGAVRGGALEIARLGRCGAALDRAALFAAGPEGLLGLRAALLETRRAARRRRGRRGAAGRALQVLRAGVLPALLA